VRGRRRRRGRGRGRGRGIGRGRGRDPGRLAAQGGPGAAACWRANFACSSRAAAAAVSPVAGAVVACHILPPQTMAEACQTMEEDAPAAPAAPAPAPAESPAEVTAAARQIAAARVAARRLAAAVEGTLPEGARVVL
jgi:hypothetical protein